MPGLQVPFEPLRKGLYSPTELLVGFDENDKASFAQTTDFQIYRYWVTKGRSRPKEYFASMMEVLHDNSITQALADLLRKKRVVAIMGGHDMDRATPPYKDVVMLTCRLTRSGRFVLSGGGPGAMEAAHLGALYANETPARLDAALKLLASKKKLPEGLSNIVLDNGTVDGKIAEQAFAWFLPAFKASQGVNQPGRSAGIPTWQYGSEPFTPFATDVAKYFENSVREDGLVTIANHGVVFAPGKAGTLQEIFQDAVVNYYRGTKPFVPMVFLGGTYWRDELPVALVLRKLFGTSNYKRNVLLTDFMSEAADFLLKFRQ